MNFEEFYEQNKRFVYRLCRVKTNRELAEESTSLAFVEIWKRWDKVSQMESPVAYTVKIARNIAYKEFLKSKARVILGLEMIEDMADSVQNPEERVIDIENTEIFWKVLSKISQREQEIIILKDLEGRSFQECADILNISLSAAKSLRHRSREKILSLLKIDPTKSEGTTSGETNAIEFD